MDTLIQLETAANRLATAVKILADYWRNDTEGCSATQQLRVPPGAPREVHRARRSILANTAKLQTLLYEPADFLQHLAVQHQLLACLQWLGDFQLLACLPRSGSVAIKDVAHLSAMSESQCSRIIRMTATAGFLREPQPGHVAHTTLSALFVTELAFRDATMFLAKSAVPAGLQMASATHRYGDTDRPSESAYNLAFDTLQSFQSACEQRSKLQRQWLAYLQYTGDADDGVGEVLTRLDWLNLGNACVVEVGAQSSATAVVLADLYPALHFVVQINGPRQGESRQDQQQQQHHHQQQPETQQQPTASCNSNGAPKVPVRSPGRSFASSDTRWTEGQINSRIALHTRAPGTPQTVDDATVYILHAPAPSPRISVRSIPTLIIAELRAHFRVLCANSRATLILTARLLPEAGTVDPDVEAIARLRDLSLLQLANEREMAVAELVDLVSSVGDSLGRLVVVSKLRSRNNVTVALSVKYQAYSNQVDLTALELSNDCRGGTP